MTACANLRFEDDSPTERAEAPAYEDRVPERVGPYRILDVLGRGGMATVFLAERRGPGGFRKLFALKRPHAPIDPRVKRLFLREARLAALVSHPNVATVFELRWHAGEPWLVMEYVEGHTLRHLVGTAALPGNKLPLAIACAIGLDAARGLHAIHETTSLEGEACHIVHRDISPSNLLVDRHGVTKVVDLGIAAPSGRSEGASGKLAYMAPEQLVGQPCDRRTDVFSLGVVLWELITGRRLFASSGDSGARRVRSPREFVRHCPGDVEAVLLRMVEASPEARPTMSQVARILAAASAATTQMDVAEYTKELAVREPSVSRMRTVVEATEIGRGRP